MLNTFLDPKEQAIHDIKEESSKCYIGKANKVINYCKYANKALRINTLIL